MNHFEQNFGALTSSFPDFERSTLEDCKDSSRIQIEPARSGEPTATSAGVYLHSKFDPRREARQLIDALPVCGCAVFLGFGLGYHVEEFLRRYPERIAVIVEPDMDVLYAAMAARSLDSVFRAPNLNLLLDVGPDALGALLSSLPPVVLGIVAPKSLVRLNEDYFDEVHAVIETFEGRQEINHNTLKRFGRRWIRNLAGNMHLLPAARPLNSLKDRYANIPALLIAAGPSLDRLLPLLPRYSDRCLVIAVDTSLRALIRAGIQPDLLVVVDPQYWNARHLDGCDTASVALVTESATYPAVFRKDFAAVYFGDSLFPLGAYLEKELGPFGNLGAGGSVATSAWDVARQLGCSPIYMAGLDLGFPDLGTHFKGSRFEEMQLNSSYRLGTAETGSFLMVNDAAPFPVESNDGGQVLTDQRLITYKWWFEGQMKMFPDTVTYNLSPGGVKIEGMEFRAVEALGESATVEDKKERLMTSAVENHDSRGAVTRNAVESLLAEMKKLGSIASEAAALSRRVQKAHPAGRKVLLDSLAALDAKLASSSGKDIAGFLIQDIARRIVESERVSELSGDAMENSLEMYTELEKAAHYHIELFERALSQS